MNDLKEYSCVGRTEGLDEPGVIFSYVVSVKNTGFLYTVFLVALQVF